MKLLDSLKSVLVSRTTTRLEQLKKLRMEAADGKEVDLDEAANLLEALEISPEEFLEQVETLKHRRQLKKTMEAGRKAGEELPAAKALLERKGEELGAIVEKRTEENQLIRGQIADLQSKSSSAQQAYSELMRGATCADLTRRVEKCNHRLYECIQAEKKISEFLRERNPELDRYPERAQFLKDQEALQKSLLAEISELKAQQESLSEERMDPNAF